MEKLKVPNHTQFPNIIIDEYMRQLTGAELKIILAIARKTIGWHKKTDRISNSQMEKLTGLTTAGIRKAVKRLLIIGIVKMERTGQGKGTKTVYEINYNGKLSFGKLSLPLQSFNSELSLPLEPSNSKLSLPTKETIKEKKIKEKEVFNTTILNYYISLTNKNRIKKVPKEVSKRFDEGCTIDEGKKIILYKYLRWWNNPEMQDNVNLVTLFRPKHFAEYLSCAEQELDGLLYKKYEEYKNGCWETFKDTGDKVKILPLKDWKYAKGYAP